MTKKSSSILLLFLSPFYMAAQNFTYKSMVQNVTKDGFYRIQLSPNISAHANNDMSDLRMMDNNGKEIPFLYKKEQSYQPDIDFYSYPILEDTNNDTWQSVIIENSHRNSIDRFIFEMKNAETDRTVRISGSNDKSKWYVVRDNFYFSMLGNGNSSNVQSLITFPTIDYRFFKVEIKTRNKQPLNILQVGYSKDITKTPSYQTVNGITYQRTDSNKKTYLHFSVKPSNRIDKIVFHISAPKLYKRDAILIKEVGQQDDYPSGISSGTKQKRIYTQDLSFELNSEKERSVSTQDFLGNEKGSDFSIEISNNDNETLLIDSITYYQLTSTITAEMRKDRTYFLYFGDTLLSSPSYDLVYFEKKIPSSIPAIISGDVQAKGVKIEEEYDQSQDKMLVWIGIGAIAIILFFITASMMKKMGKE